MDCVLCKKDTDSFMDDKTHIKYYHCIYCEFICKTPQIYKTIEEQKERYNLHDNTEEDEGYKAYFQRFLDFTLPHVGKPKKALDFGCGTTSLLSKILEDKGIQCDYYDPIYYPTPINDNKKYDLIISTEVFEHLHQPRKVFESLMGRLEKGCYLAIQTQFHANDKEVFKKWYYHQDPTHIVFYTKKSFEVLAKIYDCEVIASNEKNIVILRKND